VTSLMEVINMAHPEQMIDKCEADITGVNDRGRQERKSGDLADSTFVHEEAECSSGEQYERLPCKPAAICLVLYLPLIHSVVVRCRSTYYFRGIRRLNQASYIWSIRHFLLLRLAVRQVEA
jgi:hypothetical protein